MSNDTNNIALILLSNHAILALKIFILYKGEKMPQNTELDEVMISNRKVMFFSFVLTIVSFTGVFMLEPLISKSILVPFAGIALFAIGSYAIYRMLSAMFTAMSNAMEMASSQNRENGSDGTRLNIKKH